MRSCINCGAALEDGARFCAACGTPVGAMCGNCGVGLPEGAAFCPSCGTPTGTAAAQKGERKVVSVLFADVTGSTSIGELLDPERLRDVLNTYFAAMREEIEAEGGTVEKFIGDAVMAAFGVPVAHEDDPARALRAAQRMLARLDDVNRDLLARHDVRLQIRIGVNTGEVLATTAPQPGEPMVTGDVVNAAARLQTLADPGTVVLGERTARSVRRSALDDLGIVELKGKQERIRAFRLIGDVPLADQRGIPGLRAPMVGRDAELGILESVYARVVAEGRPSLVTIYGDAGVGKSRLTREFLTWSERQDVQALVLRGRCLPYGDGIAYWPLAEILKGHAGILDTDDPELTLEKVRKVGRSLLTPEATADPEVATAALAYTIGIDDPRVRFDEMNPRDVGDHLEAAWRSFFTALSSDAPVVVVVEDIHWADPVLLDLLEVLADRVEGPVLFLCPSRPDLTARRPAWGGGRRSMSTVALDPLTSDESQHLIELLLSVDEIPADVHRTMIERAEGNPFFLEEIIRRLIDDGSLVRRGNRWGATDKIGDVLVPDTVQAVLASRIDLLDPGDKRILQSAAVVGRVFWPGPVGTLEEMAPSDVLDALRRLEDRELVLSRAGSTMAGEREFLFKHVLTRDVTYESLPRQERVRQHRAVARWLQDTTGERATEFAELLAYHTATALQTAREIGETPDEELRRGALHWSLAASTAARRRIAFGKAERLAEDALAFAVDPVERTDALEALGMTFTDRAMGDSAYRYLREAVAECERSDPPDGLRVAYLCARACEVPQRWPGSMRIAPPEEEVRDLLERGFEKLPPGDSEARVRLMGLRAGWPFAYPSDATIEELEAYEAAGIEASEVALRIGMPNLASGALDQANGGWLAQGRYDRAQRAVDLRAAIMPQVTDVHEIGDFYAMGAWVRYCTGRYEEAVAFADEGIDRIHGRGPNFELHARGWKVLAFERLGRWDEAVEELALIRDLLGDRRDAPPYFAAAAFAAVSAIRWRRGERVESDELASVVELLGTHQGASLYPDAIRMHVARGELDLAVARERPAAWQTMKGDAVEAESEVIAATENWAAVPSALTEMRKIAEESPWPALEAAIDRLTGKAALAAGDAERGLAALAAASAAYRALGCTWSSASIDLEMAEAGTGDGAARAGSALAVFERLRTPAYLDRARAVSR